MVSNPASPVAAGGTGRDLQSGADWEYAPAPESRDIVSQNGFVNGSLERVSWSG